VRDENRVLVVAERPVPAQEVHQVRHLLQVGRELLPVPKQVRVVELQVDDVLDAVVETARVGVVLRGLSRARGGSRGADDRHRGQGGDGERGKDDPRSPSHESSFVVSPSGRI
jgi:hypothetical protein